jgi:hypothetical protein
MGQQIDWTPIIDEIAARLSKGERLTCEIAGLLAKVPEGERPTDFAWRSYWRYAGRGRRGWQRLHAHGIRIVHLESATHGRSVERVTFWRQ